MIPKIIHYCWFGGGKMPDHYAGYIEQWAQMHRDWVIKRWDECNAPMTVPYIQKAVELNNWANISNYVRLYALRTEGGIYLDTDMKLLKPLDNLLSYNCFLGFESGGDDLSFFWINNAIMGAIPSHPFVIACEERLLNQFDGSEKSNLSSPQLVTNLLKEQYSLQNYGRQLLQDIMIFEKEVFYPLPYDKTYLLDHAPTFPEESIAVHTWGRSWFDRAMLLNIIDDLQFRFDREKESIINITKELERKQNESNYLKEVLLNYKSLESSINKLFGEIINKIDQLDANTQKQQEIIEQELTRLHNELENSKNKITKQQEIITRYKKAYEDSSIWQIAKRRFLNK